MAIGNANILKRTNGNSNWEQVDTYILKMKILILFEMPSTWKNNNNCYSKKTYDMKYFSYLINNLRHKNDN